MTYHVSTLPLAPIVTLFPYTTLFRSPVYQNFWNKESGEWENHVELGMWGDLMLIAPLTANTLAKLANGFCDNLLCATYLSRSEEHTSELQSRPHIVCRLLLEKII